jgi:hypothetical protein
VDKHNEVRAKYLKLLA